MIFGRAYAVRHEVVCTLRLVQAEAVEFVDRQLTGISSTYCVELQSAIHVFRLVDR